MLVIATSAPIVTRDNSTIFLIGLFRGKEGVRRFFWEYLGRVQNANNRREFYLTEIVTHLSKDDQKIETHFIDDVVQTIGINRPAELIQAEQIAYIRSKLRKVDAGSVEPGAKLYWKLRFYEPFGGVPAENVFSRNSVDQDHLAKSLLEKYDQTLYNTIGSIYCCPRFE